MELISDKTLDLCEAYGPLYLSHKFEICRLAHFQTIRRFHNHSFNLNKWQISIKFSPIDVNLKWLYLASESTDLLEI